MKKKSNEKQFEEGRWNFVAKKMREQRSLQNSSHSEVPIENSVEDDMDWNFLDETSGSEEAMGYLDEAKKEVISLDSSSSTSSPSEGEVLTCNLTN